MAGAGLYCRLGRPFAPLAGSHEAENAHAPKSYLDELMMNSLSASPRKLNGLRIARGFGNRSAR